MNEESNVKIGEAPEKPQASILEEQQDIRSRVYGFRYCPRCNGALATPTDACQKCAIDRQTAKNSFAMVAMGALIKVRAPETEEQRKALIDEAFEYGEIGAQKTFDESPTHKKFY